MRYAPLLRVDGRPDHRRVRISDWLRIGVVLMDPIIEKALNTLITNLKQYIISSVQVKRKPEDHTELATKDHDYKEEK